MANEPTKPEMTLSEAIAKIDALNGTVATLQNDLAAANARAESAEQSLSAEQAAHANTKAECEALKNEKRDFDDKVAREVAKAAAQGGVETPPPAKSGADEVLDENDIFEKINKAKGVEKAQLMAEHHDLIVAELRKGK